MDWTGLEWTGLDWTGLDWTAANSVSLNLHDRHNMQSRVRNDNVLRCRPAI